MDLSKKKQSVPSQISTESILPPIQLDKKDSPSKSLKITNKFTAEKVMSMIDQEKLHTLGKEFEAYPDGLERNQFIELMKKSMNYEPSEELDLIHGLCKLFSEIDISGDNKMQWSEFTQYVIDAVMQNPVKRNNKGELPNQKDLLEQAHATHLKLPRFNESPAIDNCVHDGPIMRVQYFPSLDRMMVTEGKSHSVKFLSPDLKHKEFVDLHAKDNDLYNKDDLSEDTVKEGINSSNYFVLSAAYNEKDQILACVCSNRSLQLFGLYGTAFKRIKTVNSVSVQYAIWYLEKHKAWITASRIPEKKDGIKKSKLPISLEETIPTKNDKLLGPNFFNDWSFNSIGPSISVIRTIKAHNAQIMDCLEIRQPPSIATCSLDQKIRIWDLATGDKLGTLKPAHITGVRCLDYTPDYGGFIISSAHETMIKVWSPEVSIHQAYVGALEGHSNAVASAKFFKQTPYVVSIDEKLSIRVWDVRSLACLQILSQDRKKFDVNGLCVINSQLKFYVYGRRLLLFDTVVSKSSPKSGKRTDEIYPFQVVFNNYYKNFYVLTKMDVRVYDGKTGCLIKVFTNLMKTTKGVELLKFCLDDRNRKFYLGDASGLVQAYNASSGVVMKPIGETEITSYEYNSKETKKQFDKMVTTDHTKEISGLHFVDSDLNLITASHNSAIIIYDESKPEEALNLRKITGGHSNVPITCLEYGHILGLIATGDSNGGITIWDYEMSRIEGQCFQHTREIIALKFIEPYPILVSAGGDGFVSLFGVRGIETMLQYECLCRIYSLKPNDLNPTSAVLTTRCLASFTNVKIDKKYNNNATQKELKAHYRTVLCDNSKNYKFMKHIPPGNYGTDLISIIFLGDEKGGMRVINLRPLFEHYRISPVPKPWREIKSYFNPNRKGDSDVTKYYKPHRITKQAKIALIDRLMLYNLFDAHHDMITCISELNNPAGIVTSSMDQHVKLWSINGDLWGDLTIVGADPVIKWNFPYDWNEIRNTEKESLVEVLSVLNPEEKCDKNMINFEETFDNPEKSKRKKSTIVSDVIPKRSLIKPPITDNVIKSQHQEKPGKKLKTIKEENESTKKSKKKAQKEEKQEKDESESEDYPEEKYQGKLAEDVAAMLETYKIAPELQKESISNALNELKRRMSSQTQDAISQYDLLPKIKNTGKNKKTEILPQFYIKDSINSKNDHFKQIKGRYAITCDDKDKDLNNPVLKAKLTKALSLDKLHGKRNIGKALRDKKGLLCSLGKIDVTNVARNSNLASASVSIIAGPQMGINVKYSPGEVNRQMELSMLNLKMKKMSDIQNYQQKDNETAKTQMKLLEELTQSGFNKMISK